MRLPNSMKAWPSCGVSDWSLQRGQSWQPRPEPVSRTAAPVMTMSVNSTSADQAA